MEFYHYDILLTQKISKFRSLPVDYKMPMNIS